MLTQIYNGQVLTPEGWIKGGSVIIEDSRIKEVSKSSRLLEGMDKAIDAHNMYVVPGGIDLHCHGGGGSDFQECTREAFEIAAQTHLKHGTTAIFATLSSSPLDMMERACQTCDELMREPRSTIMGMHMEGPYFNPSRAGAQMPEVIRIPAPDEYRHIVEDFDCMRRWSSAPELPGAIEMGKYIDLGKPFGIYRDSRGGYHTTYPGFSYPMFLSLYNKLKFASNIEADQEQFIDISSKIIVTKTQEGDFSFEIFEGQLLTPRLSKTLMKLTLETLEHLKPEEELDLGGDITLKHDEDGDGRFLLIF